MQKPRSLICAVLGISLIVPALPLSSREPAGWHHPLCLARGGVWKRRVPVDISNRGDNVAQGRCVTLPVGKGRGQADLEGARAEAVRVCDAAGVEMLFRITGAGGRSVRRGPLPPGSSITLPAECPARGRATYYVYFDNPSAWEVPDFLTLHAGVLNGGVEDGEGGVPFGWRHDPGDDLHRAFWADDEARSGKRSLKTVVSAEAEPTWIATRQHGIRITGGGRYVLRAWVKADRVKGFAGWYIHLGNDTNPMLTSPMLNGGGGTYDWKELSIEFEAPVGASRADLGTVLRGTGTAWFDDMKLESRSPEVLEAAAGPVEELHLKEIHAKPGVGSSWDFLVPVKLFNTTTRPLSGALVTVDLSPVLARDSMRKQRFAVTLDGGRRPVCRQDGRVFFEADVPARSAVTFDVYLQAGGRAASGGPASYEPLLHNRLNLVRDGSFEKEARDWNVTSTQADIGRSEPGLFGKYCGRVKIGENSSKTWVGWRQSVPVEPGGTYLYAAWVKCKDIQTGDVRLHAHLLDKAGRLSSSGGFAGVGPPLSGTHDWTLLSGRLTMPRDVATLELHLTMNATGTVWHDGVVVARVADAVAGKLQRRVTTGEDRLAVWPVNAIVKVFRDDPPPQEAPPLAISLARNEKEPLQIAIRGPAAVAGMEVIVDRPRTERGAELDDVTINVVGYVPIDHKTSYYRSETPVWHRKLPSGAGACDGWPGFWPDPLLPRAGFDLAPRSTQPVWITVGAPKDAPAGDYRGRIRLLAGRKTLASLPFTVHVWDFALPEVSHLAAVYDLRIGTQWLRPGENRQEAWRRFCRFMARRRVCPHRIYPDPVLRFESERVVADFEKYDEAAEYYLDELHLPMTYTPAVFYLFGWGHPPGVKFGEKPYEGEYPYEGVDRSKLRPAFKKAYQACLRVYWEHMKARGWDKKCVLYISDEPHDSTVRIRDQMKALCDMIHEVDPAIPIYSSTWHHQPVWDGHLDVWGIGHYGIVAPELMARLKAGGSRLWFTTDGQMCTDTPFCAVERLLPHYCFRYGVEAYEFWGVSWLTYDPYEFGWHSYIHQSSQPGTSFYVRYPNGDGYLAYPGKPVGHPRAP